jgi:magnesium-transporting ATPase (P-type)
MSIVIRDKGFIKIYTKGADSIVKQRLSQKSELNLDT